MAIAIAAIGIFTLPGTVSRFSGQHSGYGRSPYGSQVPCEKCHSDITDEMTSTGAHKEFPCENCHRTDADVGSYASDINVQVLEWSTRGFDRRLPDATIIGRKVT